MKVFQKINISVIVKSHLATIKNDNSKKPDADDYFTFVGIPFLFAGALSYFSVSFDEKSINIIITSLSIFVGLLFNVVVLIFDIINRDSSGRNKNRLLKELITNICFSILVSIICIMLIIATYIELSFLKRILEFLIFILLSEFCLTLFMILKRVYFIFTNEIDEIENNALK